MAPGSAFQPPRNIPEGFNTGRGSGRDLKTNYFDDNNVEDDDEAQTPGCMYGDLAANRYALGKRAKLSLPRYSESRCIMYMSHM